MVNTKVKASYRAAPLLSKVKRENAKIARESKRQMAKKICEGLEKKVLDLIEDGLDERTTIEVSKGIISAAQIKQEQEERHRRAERAKRGRAILADKFNGRKLKELSSDEKKVYEKLLGPKGR